MGRGEVREVGDKSQRWDLNEVYRAADGTLSFLSISFRFHKTLDLKY